MHKFDQEQIQEYNETANHIFDVLTECGNFTKWKSFCIPFGCEYYQICGELHSEYTPDEPH